LSLARFDSLLRSAIQGITNSDLLDIQWLQASLLVKDAGLGVRRMSSLALPALLASAASTLSLQADILADCACSENDSFQSYLSDWSSVFGHSSRQFAAQTTLLGSPWHFGRRSSSEVQTEHPGTAGFFLGCFIPTQWRLASGNANIVMWVEA